MNWNAMWGQLRKRTWMQAFDIVTGGTLHDIWWFYARMSLLFPFIKNFRNENSICACPIQKQYSASHLFIKTLFFPSMCLSGNVEARTQAYSLKTSCLRIAPYTYFLHHRRSIDVFVKHSFCTHAWNLQWFIVPLVTVYLLR